MLSICLTPVRILIFFFSDFEHPVEAVQAISMLHDQIYYDRRLSVQMAKGSQLDELTGRNRQKDKNSLKLPKGLQSLGMGLGARGLPMKEVPSK